MDRNYSILFLPDAELDLQAIDEHLSQFSESAPAKFFNELENGGTKIGEIKLGGLFRGESRDLTPKEIDYLKGL